MIFIEASAERGKIFLFIVILLLMEIEMIASSGIYEHSIYKIPFRMNEYALSDIDKI